MMRLATSYLLCVYIVQACTGNKAYKDKKRIPGLSFSWDIPGTKQKTIWEKCDQDYTC